MMKVTKTILTVTLLATGLQVAHAVDWEALPEQAPAPADNPTTPEKVLLGKTLFFDPRFSSTGTVSCNSCHNVMLGGDDNRPNSMGVHGQTGARSSPTVWNSAFSSVQFWDGRADSLEAQAKGPVTNPIEMGMSDLEIAMDRVRSIPGYQPLFSAAFGAGKSMTVDNAAKAVAAYERTLITPNSPYDRFVKGEKQALTEQQQRGMQRFASVGCTSCHSGPAFNGPKLPDGNGFFMKFPTFGDSKYVQQYKLQEDTGRAQVTGKEADQHFFNVPTLRNVALTAPYFHNGAAPTLEEAVKVMASTQLNQELSKNDVVDLVAFLTSLSGPFPRQEMPQLPPTQGWYIQNDK